MYDHLLTCIVFHEKEYKDKLCCAASYIEIYMIYMCICVFFLSEVAIISKLYFNLLDRSFVLITIQFDIINFFLIYSNTILKNSIHIALTKSIFFFGQILWCYTLLPNRSLFQLFCRDSQRNRSLYKDGFHKGHFPKVAKITCYFHAS